MDRPTHLAELDIAVREEYSRPYVKVPVTLFQDHLDGLYTMLVFIEGFSKTTGIVPGTHECIMLYRNLVSSIDKAESDHRSAKAGD